MKALKGVMEQKMDRRSFLIRIGLLFLGLIGLNAILRAFSGDNSQQSSGYGSGPYGGGDSQH